MSELENATKQVRETAQSEEILRSKNQAAAQPAIPAEFPALIPVIEERLRVGKRIIETGRVNISKQVNEHQELVDIPLTRENVEVQRVPINQYVDAPPPPVRYEGNTMIVAVLREELVVSKRLVLVEEIRITKQQVETHAPQEVTLLKEEVLVRRTDVDNQ